MFRRLACVAGLVFLSSCKKPEETPASAPVIAQPAVPIDPNAPPVLSLLGGGSVDVLPETLVFDWNQPTDVSPRIALSPTVSGKTAVEGTRVVFTPDTPLRYATEYKVTSNGATARLVTPAFVARRAELVKIEGRHATLAVSFSGPVEASAVKSGLSLTPGTIGRVEKQSRTEVYASIELPKAGASVSVVVKAGIKSSAHGAETPMALEQVLITEVKGEITIAGVTVHEGAEGFYFEVMCNDQQTKNKWGYWDYNVEQCPIEPDIVDRYVSISPRVKLSVSRTRTGFRLFGDLRYGQYTLRLQSGMYATTQSILQKTFEQAIAVPHRRKTVAFAAQGRYLPRTALKQVPLSHMNAGEVTIRVRHVPQQNVLFWLSAPNDIADDRVADEVATQTFTLHAKVDEKATTWLDLSKLVGAQKEGVYEFLIDTVEPKKTSTDEDEPYEEWEERRKTIAAKHDAARLVLTDLVVVAKRHGASDLSVWVRDAHQLDAVSGAKVELYTFSNRLIKSAQTDGDGRVKLTDIVDPTTKKDPFAIIVRKGDDLTFLELAELQIDLAESDVAGDPFANEVPYSAAMYSDRGVYRPGETAHVMATVRGANNAAPPEGLPVTATVLDPKKRATQTQHGKTNAAGMVSFDVSFQSFADTGRYEVDLGIGQKHITSYAFNVEEFVPERMKVQVTSAKAEVGMQEPAQVEIEARYLFGAKASKEAVELLCMFEPVTFKPKQNTDYSYGVWSERGQTRAGLEPVAGTLDDNGRGKLSCPVPKMEWRGAARITAQASVLEAGSGRATTGQATVTAHPAPYYIGLQSPAHFKMQEVVRVQGIVVDWQGNIEKTPRTIDLEILRLDPEYNWEWIGGRYNWKINMRVVRESAHRAKLEDGKFSFTFPTGWAASYVIRAKSGAAETDLKVDADGFSYWPSGNGSDTTPRPMKPTALDMTVPKELRVGQDADVTIRAPYPGKVLLTVESNDVIDARWVAVKAGESTHKIKIDKFLPNAYVSALLLKDPHSESAKAYMPARAFGVRSVPVVPEAYKQPLALAAPKEVKPHDELVVTLDTGPVETGTFATVAAVDEGILQLTRFKTPNVLAELFQKRALGVLSYETYGWSLLVPAADKSPGGGDPSGGNNRIAPVKPVALWSGIVEANKSGKTTVRFRVPQYRGELRVMAVVVSPNKAASAEASVTVRDPLVLQATFPRFLITDDRFVVPVSVTNMTGKATEVTVKLDVEGGVELEKTREKKTKIEAGKSETVTFTAKTTGSNGAAKLKVVAAAPGHESRDEGEIPLWPNAPFVRELSVIELKQGDNDLTRTVAAFLPQHERTSVWVTANRYGRELGHLRYLVRYPYGCIEQTTSTLKPLLNVSALIQSVDPDLVQKESLEKKVMYGVRRLLSMQTASGGFSYWPGANEPTYWGTAYATHTLLEAKAQGYPVPEERLEDALRFMETTVQNDAEGRDARYGYTIAKSAPYMHFVLAKAQRGNKAKMRELLEKHAAWDELDVENAFLLRAGLYLAGDRRFEAELKKADAVDPKISRTNEWWFWSSLRTRGMQLLVREELFPADPSAEPLAMKIAEALRKNSESYYYTTQELSWTVSALGKRAGVASKDFTVGKLERDGKAITSLVKKPDERETTWVASGLSGGKKLSLGIDKLGAGSLFALVTVEGMKPGAPHRLGEHGLRVARDYKKAAKLGEIIEIELTIENTTSEEVKNIALVDRFGAGLEIENPRLNRVGASGTSDAWDITYMNLRDDRIELFGHLKAHERATFRYAVRAVTAGRFDTPPLNAEAMYDPATWAAIPGEMMTILDPWNAM